MKNESASSPKVSEVPPDEVLAYASDLASLQARIGGVMVAAANAMPTSLRR